jgi:hypothetical protein
MNDKNASHSQSGWLANVTVRKSGTAGLPCTDVHQSGDASAPTAEITPTSRAAPCAPEGPGGFAHSGQAITSA